MASKSVVPFIKECQRLRLKRTSMASGVSSGEDEVGAGISQQHGMSSGEDEVGAGIGQQRGMSSGEDEVGAAIAHHPRRRHTLRRGSSVACDTDIRKHRGSISDHVDYSHNRCNAEIQREGEVLFETFVAEQIQREGMRVDDVGDERLDEGQRELQTHCWVEEGAVLRRVADSFAQTQERANVRERAAGIDASQITSTRFLGMLSELFNAGRITRERIVVLFFFCSDLAIRVLKQKSVDLFKRLMDWTLEFIRDRVCSWVADHGGWGAVFSGSFTLIRRVVLLGTLIIASLSIYRWLQK